jgi:hypothetical protein
MTATPKKIQQPKDRIWINANPSEIVEKFTNADGEEWTGPFEHCLPSDNAREVEDAVNRRIEDLTDQGCTDIMIFPRDY